MSSSLYQVTFTTEVEAEDDLAAEGVIEETLVEAGFEDYIVEAVRRIAGPNKGSAIDFTEDEESHMLNEGVLG